MIVSVFGIAVDFRLFGEVAGRRPSCPLVGELGHAARFQDHAKLLAKAASSEPWIQVGPADYLACVG